MKPEAALKCLFRLFLSSLKLYHIMKSIFVWFFSHKASETYTLLVFMKNNKEN